ncbi:MAG: FAD-dependent oxidoreductase [Synergistaceae bacterium]|jgi:dihydrolipoamide dehydrogenase|nr:FAD-dependent oxidoreductase [Synergistaceae bacterium]
MRIVVIGAGPGGYAAALRAAARGADVTLIERGSVGGTCLNEGCIPMKVLLHSAAAMNFLRSDARRVGVVLAGAPRLDWGALMKRKAFVTARLASAMTGVMQEAGVKYVNAPACLAAPNAVKAGDSLFHADAVVLATGSVPFLPDGAPGALTSREALSLSAVPDSLSIYGGGAVGIELASAFASFGSKVTVVVASSEILRSMDQECAAIVRRALEKRGMTFRLSENPRWGEQDKSETETTLHIIAKGRRPCTEVQLLGDIGVETDAQGRVLTDLHMETSVHGVYAVGDCARSRHLPNSFMLAHVASREGEVAADNAVGVHSQMDYSAVPSCVYTTPEFASVGITEAEAKRNGIPVTVRRSPLAANGKSVITGDTGGLIKVVASADGGGKIMGVQMVGGPATEMIAEAVLAMTLGANIDALATPIRAHPTVSESVRGG